MEEDDPEGKVKGCSSSSPRRNKNGDSSNNWGKGNKGKVVENIGYICDAKFEERTQGLKEELQLDIFDAQRNKEEALQSLLKTSALLRTDMNAMAEDSALIRILSILLETRLTRVEEVPDREEDVRSNRA